MGKIFTDSAYYHNIADAIRGKTGSNLSYKPSEMAGAIQEINTGYDVSGVTAGAEDVRIGKSIITSDGNLVDGTLNTNKICYGDRKSGIQVQVHDSGQTISCSVNSLSNGKKVEDLKIVVIYPDIDVTNWNANDVTALAIQLVAKGDGTYDTYDLYGCRKNGQGFASSPNNPQYKNQIVTASISGTSLRIRLTDHYFTRTDGYNMKFHVANNAYNAIYIFEPYD